MNQKILWKIESLWEKYKKSSKQVDFSIDDLYEKGISKYNPDFRQVDDFNFGLSRNIVHSDDYGEYHGFLFSQVKKINGKYVYLFDNHNKILQPFLEYFEIQKQPFDVVHIDAHDDDAIFERGDSGSEAGMTNLVLRDIQKYIEQTRISDFFDFLSRVVIPSNEGIQSPLGSSQKMIKNVYRYTNSADFEIFNKPKNPYILSLDIDIFGPEGDFTDIESKVKIIAQAWSGAEMVCIATSPGFIDQGFAVEIIKIFMKFNLN